MKATIYLKDTDENTWDEFKEIADREGSSASEKIAEFIRKYVDVHRHGNPQTLILTFADGKRLSLEKRFQNLDCEHYHASSQGKPWCSLTYASPWDVPARCFLCDTGRYSRPET